jgi:hypothetical protein
MAAAFSSPGSRRPLDLEEIIVVPTTGAARNGDPALTKSPPCRVSRIRGRRSALLHEGGPLRCERHQQSDQP